jgi:hypothetical protein
LCISFGHTPPPQFTSTGPTSRAALIIIFATRPSRRRDQGELQRVEPSRRLGL